MGWSSGSSLGDDLYRVVREFIPEEKRLRVAEEFIDILEDMGADTMDEAELLWADAHPADEEEAEDNAQPEGE